MTEFSFKFKEEDKKYWQKCFLSYSLPGWSESISKGRVKTTEGGWGGYPYIGDLFILAQEILEDTK